MRTRRIARPATVMVGVGVLVAAASLLPAQAIGTVPVVSSTSTITTIAGNGVYGFAGDGGLASGALIAKPRDTAMGPDGSLYVSDTYNNRIRKIDPAGVITTVAGNGVGAYAGDNGPATSASIKWPHDVTIGPDGCLYIADSNNNRIRKVDLNGIITTVAGTGTGGYNGDNRLATTARLRNPKSVAFYGPDLYIADSMNHRIRKVDSVTGIITTVAGTGVAAFSGDGGPATAAAMNTPQRIAFDTLGNLFLTDTANNRIRRVDVTTGVISTIAGNGVSGYSGNGGLAVKAALKTPRGITVVNDNVVYISDSGNHRVRMVSLDSGIITTIAGTGSTSYTGDGGPAGAAGLYNPRGLTTNDAGDLIVADTFHNAIRLIAVSPIQ